MVQKAEKMFPKIINEWLVMCNFLLEVKSNQNYFLAFNAKNIE